MAKKYSTFKVSAAVAGCTSSLVLALVAAPLAAADPADPLPPLPPAPVSQEAGTQIVASPDGVVAPPDVIVPPPDGVAHLASPDSLPPGATMDPSVKGTDSPNMSYLRDLFHAVQDHQISGKEALVMGFAQRGMNTPYPDQGPGPNRPTSPGDDPAPPPPPPADPLLPTP